MGIPNEKSPQIRDGSAVIFYGFYMLLYGTLGRIKSFSI